MKIVNLTPHRVVLKTDDSGIWPEYSSEGVAKVNPVYHNTFMLGTIPVKMLSFYETENLPEPSGDTKYIVTPDVKAAFSHRTDLMTIDKELMELRKGKYTIHVKHFII